MKRDKGGKSCIIHPQTHIFPLNFFYRDCYHDFTIKFRISVKSGFENTKSLLKLVQHFVPEADECEVCKIKTRAFSLISQNR